MAHRRSLGQNFLADDSLLQLIAAAANFQPGARVLEIGPGKGSLTRQLLRAGASVLAVEKDARLVQRLQSSFPEVCRPMHGEHGKAKCVPLSFSNEADAGNAACIHD